jgi:hypothetical protein
VKDRYQNAGHEIDEIGAGRCVDWHDAAFLWDHQAQKLKLQHDDLPRIRQRLSAEGYREPGLRRRVVG